MGPGPVDQIQTQVRVLSTVTERSVVRAPFAGVVAERWHNVGDTVQPSSTDPVLRLVDPTRVEISAQVTPAQLLRIVPGQAATVAPVGTNLSEPATVATRPAAGSPAATASVEIRLAFSGPTQLTIQTGVVIEIILDERNNVVVVPLAAVIKKDDATYVMVAGADGRAHRRDVRVGLQSHDRAEIVSGVTSGDEVIVERARRCDRQRGRGDRSGAVEDVWASFHRGIGPSDIGASDIGPSGHLSLNIAHDV